MERLSSSQCQTTKAVVARRCGAMLLVAFHFGSEEFRRCPPRVAACARMSHLAAPIGKDWAKLTRPEIQAGARHPAFSGRSLVPTWRALKSPLRRRIWATAARIDGWGASRCRKTLDSETCLISERTRVPRRAANWLIETPGREARGAMEVQVGEEAQASTPTNMRGFGWLERTAARWLRVDRSKFG